MSKSLLLMAGAASMLAAGLAIAQPADAPPPPMGGPHGGHPGQGMKAADKDGDGALSKDEFLARSVDHFAAMDANKDGKLTLAEFQTRPLEMFAKMDANKDGKITKDERMAMHKEMRGKWKEHYQMKQGGAAQPN